MPPLPIELRREIVEIAIRTNHKDRAVKLTLSLVAHHVHFWVNRIFYELVEIKRSKHVDQFLNLVDSKPAGFSGKGVKRLSIWCAQEDLELDRLLAACPGIQAFACLTLGRALPPLPLSGLSLRRLSIDTGFAEMLNSAVQPTWCSTLTHLDLGFPGLLFERQMVRRLPCLTNIALHSSSTDRPLADALYSDCADLRVLVILTSDEEQEAVKYRDAPHVVLANDLEEEWDMGLFSDLWICAESIVAVRKARTKVQSG